MTAFSSEWLKLREAADVKARNREVSNALSARFAQRNAVTVVDLGSGTGSNLRATAPLLPNLQTWTLVDHDSALLDSARRALSAWADTAKPKTDDPAGLTLTKGYATIHVRFLQCNLASDLDTVLSQPVDLVTASALFDLVSADFVRAFAHALADRRAVFYGALTYNGIQRWQPHRPTDSQMTSAFHRHQLGDKGFGPALGPMASAHLADQFRLNGYLVLEGESPWQLSRNDRMLIDELVRGHAMAVAETGAVDIKTIEAWVKVQRTGAETGHTDIYAVPT